MQAREKFGDEEISVDLSKPVSEMTLSEARVALNEVTREMSPGEIAVALEQRTVKGVLIASFQGRMTDLKRAAGEVGVVYATSPNEPMHHRV